MGNKISVVINTYNAEKHLDVVLESVKDFDEVVVCDMHSTDGTIEIAQRHGCKVVYCQKYSYVEPARNFAISNASNEWVLVLDADETVPEALKNYLYEVAEKGEVGGVYIPFKNYFMGVFMRSAYPDFKLRFFKKEGFFWSEAIHSTPEVKGRVIKIPRSRKELASEHLANDSINTILSKNNVYSSFDAVKKQNKKITFFSLIFSPIFWFIKYYFLKLGILDGKKGFIFACLKSQYKFSCLAKVYEYQHNRKK